jgi:hypothetical protein
MAGSRFAEVEVIGDFIIQRSEAPLPWGEGADNDVPRDDLASFLQQADLERTSR